MDVPEKCNGCSDTGQWKRGVCQYWHNFYSEPRRMARCNDRGPYLSNEALDVDEMKYPDVIYATEKKCHICWGKGKINVGDADAPDIIICPECSGKGHLA